MPRPKAQLLHGPLLKLDRAQHHIDDLKAQVDAFLAGKPFTLIIQMRSNPGKLALRVKRDRAIPESFSLIIGDAVHNLRSTFGPDCVRYGPATGFKAREDPVSVSQKQQRERHQGRLCVWAG